MFQGGIHPPAFKELSCKKPIVKPPLPERVIIPLIQHTGAPSEPVVKVGDFVKTGQLIARSNKFISSFIHSSVTGKVASIKNSPHPILGDCKAVTIESSGKDEHQEISQAEDIKETVREAGIVGLGGAAFPTHVKLSPPSSKKIDTFI